jgi:molybdate transport repressor ModE-like protein
MEGGTAVRRLVSSQPVMAADWWAGIELRHLVALDAVAREGSFRRAATRLGYVQSAISHQIAALENLTGKRLIERSRGTRPLSLTDAGEILLDHADAVIARVRAAQADLAALDGSGAPVLRVSRAADHPHVARDQPATLRRLA